MDIYERRRLWVLRLIDGQPFNGNRKQFGEAVKISQSYVTRMVKAAGEKDQKRIGDDLAIRIADALGLDQSDGLNPGSIRAAGVNTADGGWNVSPVHRRRRVPLISWVQAGQMSGTEDARDPDQASDFADLYDDRAGSNTFALRVEGDSMTSPTSSARSFPEGTILIVDPDRGASAGDFVIAKDIQTQRATFKQLVTDGSRWFLKPINPAYPTIEIDDPTLRVIGRVIEFHFRGRL